jgi:uncharacterized membrane protein YbhN (UPF0104 family)
LAGKHLGRVVRALLGFLLALALVGWVVRRNGIDVGQVLSSVDREIFLLAFLVYGIGILSASWRWYLLLHHIRVHLPYLTVLRLALIGLFFNLFIPGGVGGDVIKMVYLKRESGDRYPQALLTVLLDRLLGLAGLLGIALIAIALNRPLISSGSVEMKSILAVVGLACLGAFVCGVAFLAWPLVSRWRIVSSLGQRLPAGVVAIAAKVGEALDLLRAAPLKLFGLLLLSTVGHLSGTVGVYLMALGVGAQQYLSFSECLLANQLANLVAAIPLTPGGVGNRDLVMSLLLGAAGAPPVMAGSVPLMITVLLLSWSLVGGMALLWERGAGASAGIDLEASNPAE